MKVVNSCSVQALIHELLLWTSGFNPRVVHIGCVVDIMAHGHVFLWLHQISPVNYHFTHNPYCFICYLWYGQQNHQRLQFQQIYRHPTLRIKNNVVRYIVSVSLHPMKTVVKFCKCLKISLLLLTPPTPTRRCPAWSCLVQRSWMWKYWIPLKRVHVYYCIWYHITEDCNLNVLMVPVHYSLAVLNKLSS